MLQRASLHWHVIQKPDVDVSLKNQASGTKQQQVNRKDSLRTGAFRKQDTGIRVRMHSYTRTYALLFQCNAVNCDGVA